MTSEPVSRADRRANDWRPPWQMLSNASRRRGRRGATWQHPKPHEYASREENRGNSLLPPLALHLESKEPCCFHPHSTSPFPLSCFHFILLRTRLQDLQHIVKPHTCTIIHDGLLVPWFHIYLKLLFLLCVISDKILSTVFQEICVIIFQKEKLQYKTFRLN